MADIPLSPTSPGQSLSLRVLTLNIWGLKHVSKFRPIRVRAIAAALAGTPHDVVCLQEVWVYDDFVAIRDTIADSFPYSKYFFSGAVGSGLCVFSRHAIQSSSFLPYRLNGPPLEVAKGDFFAGKGAGSVVLYVSGLGDVEVFNTHFHAAYDEHDEQCRYAHRLAQAWELGNLVRGSSERGRHVIVTGDVNTLPSSLTLQLLLTHASLTDVWPVLHPPSAHPPQNPHEAVARDGITADNALNSFHAHKLFSDAVHLAGGKRLDYVLFRGPAAERAPPRASLAPQHAEVVFTERVPGQDFSYSDHFGVSTTFAITPSAPAHSTSSHAPPLPAALRALTTYYAHSISLQRTHLLFFLLLLALALALIVASAFLPSAYFAPILVLAGIAAGWGGTTFLYVGWVYGRWEANGLRSVVEEMENEVERRRRGRRVSAGSRRESGSG